MAISHSFVSYPPAADDSPPSNVGVYELAWPARTSTGYRTVYIGQGIIDQRLRAHWRSDKTWAVYRCKVINSRRRAKQIERKAIRQFMDKHDRLPKYNQQLG